MSIGPQLPLTIRLRDDRSTRFRLPREDAERLVEALGALPATGRQSTVGKIEQVTQLDQTVVKPRVPEEEALRAALTEMKSKGPLSPPLDDLLEALQRLAL